MDEGDLEGGVDRDVLDELPVSEVTRELPQPVEDVLDPGVNML